MKIYVISSLKGGSASGAINAELLKDNIFNLI